MYVTSVVVGVFLFFEEKGEEKYEHDDSGNFDNVGLFFFKIVSTI